MTHREVAVRQKEKIVFILQRHLITKYAAMTSMTKCDIFQRNMDEMKPFATAAALHVL